MTTRARLSRPPRAVRVALTSDHGLVAEAVAAALRTWSFDTMLVRWPTPPVGSSGSGQRRLTLRYADRPADVGLVLSDLTRTRQVHAAQLVVGSRPTLPWVVMAGTPRGPAWGALYDGGATLVVPTETGLTTISGILVDLAEGGRSPVQRRERRELVQLWRSFVERRSDVTARLESLTERETEVLGQLYQGIGVRDIAEQSHLAEGTVRSHVKAILKKLDVNSQVAAVAVYEDVLTDAMPRTTLANHTSHEDEFDEAEDHPSNR